MILTDYYRFEKLSGQKSKMRIDCTASTKSYNPFEGLRNKHGELFLYVGDNTHTKAGRKRKSDLALTRTTHLSSIYHPDIEKPLYYGDMKETADAFLIMAKDFTITNGRVADGAVIDIFIARGKRNDRTQLYNLLADGELDEEINTLRNQVTKSVTDTQSRENTLY